MITLRSERRNAKEHKTHFIISNGWGCYWDTFLSSQLTISKSGGFGLRDASVVDAGMLC